MAILDLIKENLQAEEFQTGNKRLRVYHGDDFGLEYINGNYPLMSQEESNQQEGPGLYFAKDPRTARRYGKHVVTTTINPTRFLHARRPIENKVSTEDIANMVHELHETDEDFWYLMSDYVYAEEREGIGEEEIQDFAEQLSKLDARNFLITIEEATSTQLAVEMFLKHTGYYGTYNPQRGSIFLDGNDVWFAILHNDEDIEKVNMKELDIEGE